MTRPALGLVDTHAHLGDPQLTAELPALLERARAAGVAQIVVVATTAEDSGAVTRLVAGHSGLFAAVGIHPNDAAQAQSDDWERVERLLDSPKVVALGETGLDRYRDRTPFALQQEWFGRHLSLGQERGLPVVIHCRQSEQDLIDQMRSLRRPVRGVLHSFTGSWDDAQAFLDLGLHISFAGMVTFTNKSLDALREVAARVPADRLLVETDCPYLSPHPHRGKTNEPGYVALTAARLAGVRGVTLDELVQQTTANARQLFNLPQDHIL